MDSQEERNDKLLRDIRDLESGWLALYKRKLTMAEREAYFWGRAHEIRSEMDSQEEQP